MKRGKNDLNKLSRQEILIKIINKTAKVALEEVFKKQVIMVLKT